MGLSAFPLRPRSRALRRMFERTFAALPCRSHIRRCWTQSSASLEPSAWNAYAVFQRYSRTWIRSAMIVISAPTFLATRRTRRSWSLFPSTRTIQRRLRSGSRRRASSKASDDLLGRFAHARPDALVRRLRSRPIAFDIPHGTQLGENIARGPRVRRDRVDRRDLRHPLAVSLLALRRPGAQTAWSHLGGRVFGRSTSNSVGVQLWREVQRGVHRMESLDIARLVRDAGDVDLSHDAEDGTAARPAIGSLGANRTLRQCAQLVMAWSSRRRNSRPSLSTKPVRCASRRVPFGTPGTASSRAPSPSRARMHPPPRSPSW